MNRAGAAATPAGAAGAGSWRDYWSRDRLWRDSELLRLNAETLLRRLPERFPLGAGDTVLDVGCGPGHLEALLATRVARVHAVDVSAPFVEICRERCRGLGNVTAGVLGEDYTDLGGLPGPFTRVICMSVVQYYRSPAEVAALIASARSVCAPGALLLLGDLPRPRGPAGFAWDAACTLLRGVREGYLPALLRAARGRWAAGSGYARCAGRLGQLSFTPAGLAALTAPLRVRTTLLRGSLSVHANRPSLLVAF